MIAAEVLNTVEVKYSTDRDETNTSLTFFAKRVLDVVGASVLLLLTAPLFVALALAIATDRGPILFAHTRIGRHGQAFRCLKFRTMRTDADRALTQLLRSDPAARAEWDARRKLKRDPRVTSVGRVLRSTSIDEIPQLINVLRGEMSLVGPRPVVQEELQAHYDEAAAASYMSVRPGLTGLWQVSGRSDTDYRERVSLDREYVRTLSIGTDILLLVRTLGVVLRRTGAY